MGDKITFHKPTSDHSSNSPQPKFYLSLNYVQSFYKFHFTCYDIKHTDSGEVQSQCCQLSGPTSHVFWHMTLCHEVSGSRRFGVPSPSRANSLLGPPDREERTPQLHLCENPRTCTCNSLPREGQAKRWNYGSGHKTGNDVYC